MATVELGYTSAAKSQIGLAVRVEITCCNSDRKIPSGNKSLPCSKGSITVTEQRVYYALVAVRNAPTVVLHSDCQIGDAVPIEIRHCQRVCDGAEKVIALRRLKGSVAVAQFRRNTDRFRCNY